MESVWLYLAEPRPGAEAECLEQQRWKERLMLWVPRQLGSNINRLHGECVQPLLAGRMASEAQRWGEQRAHACMAHTVIKANGRNPMAENQARTRPPSSPPTGQQHRAPSLTALIPNEANTEKNKPKPETAWTAPGWSGQRGPVTSLSPALGGRPQSLEGQWHTDSILCSWSLLLGLTDLASTAHKRVARSICN